MAIDERARRLLHERLDATIGPQAADVLMEELALIGREQLATRHDIELLRGDMDAGFASLRGDMDAGFASLRGDFASLRGDFEGLRGEFATMRRDVGGEIAGLRAELYQQLGEQRDRVDAQTRQLIFWMLGSMLTVAAMAFGAAQLT